MQTAKQDHAWQTCVSNWRKKTETLRTCSVKERKKERKKRVKERGAVKRTMKIEASENQTKPVECHQS